MCRGVCVSRGDDVLSPDVAGDHMGASSITHSLQHGHETNASRVSRISIMPHVHSCSAEAANDDC